MRSNIAAVFKRGHVRGMFRGARSVHEGALRVFCKAVVACACVLPGTVFPAAALTDGIEGMTCRFFAAGARLAWQREGGDWIDSKGIIHGESAFARQRVEAGAVRTQLDATALVTRALGRKDAEANFFIRSVSPQRKDSMSFHSRESADPSRVPKLEIDWESGGRSILTPSADSVLNCSTSKSLGGRSTLKVGSEENLAIVFALPAERSGQRIRGAQLYLEIARAPRAGAEIGVFGVALPSLERATPQKGLAAAYKADINIERHAAIVLAERFEDEGWESRWSDRARGNNVSIVADDPPNHMLPLAGKALKVTISEGKMTGLNMLYRFASGGKAEPDEMYFRYYLRLAENWDPFVSGGKLPGFAGTYGRAGWGGRRSNGKNGWSMRGAFFQARGQATTDRLRGVGSYAYYADMEGHYGSNWGWNSGKTGALQKNRWYSIEQYVKLNSPGRADGIFRAWVDGELAFENTALRYRDVPDLRIESLWMNVYHGGTKPAAQDLTLYIDNLVIAREYIGPAAFEK